MQLTFAGSPDVAAPRETVWARLLDPSAVAASAPGVESVEALDPSRYRVVCAFGVGSIKARFTLHVQLSDLAPPESARMRAHGTAPGSVVDVQTGVRLEPLGEGQIRLHWIAEATIGGTIASVGARLFEGTARRIMDRFWQDFAARAASPAGSPLPETPSGAPPPVPTGVLDKTPERR